MSRGISEASQQQRNGNGVGGVRRKDKGGKSITMSWTKCFPRPSCHPDSFVCSHSPKKAFPCHHMGQRDDLSPRSCPLVFQRGRNGSHGHTQRNGAPRPPDDDRGTWQRLRKSTSRTHRAGQNPDETAALHLLVIPSKSCSALEAEPGALGWVAGDHSWSCRCRRF